MIVDAKIEIAVTPRFELTGQGEAYNNNNNGQQTAMTTHTISDILYGHGDLGFWSTCKEFLSRIVLMMTAVKSDEDREGSRDDRSPNERFWHYLDGYLFGYDLYPVCERQLFVKNDAYAILQDFWVVGATLNGTTQELIKSPEAVVKENTAVDDIRRRKIEAAKSAIAAIRAEKIQRSDED